MALGAIPCFGWAPQHTGYDLVSVSSFTGRVPRKDNSVHSATKHAIYSFSAGQQA
ncbi:hypothetical protein OHT20_37510 [Streptomyces caniferus]|uniref:Uncharacterized protein n=1 Tax=Streptomyces caniferus TaxID=285557 RepID=A0A640S9Q5_9ACTN|nr:hypothetical protein [Streptomyces caniferus]GFE07554.1 hypothetical protein Scani_38220 [Streptomyces caniferus]